ncbi:hypothetical protein ABEG63_15860 [Chryseobacterium sp. C39-AII1]|uniref:hypothetical protein n=1 Tax=Chryseobacterium sp. C39-AII1 TaxID=3080332 RepID=UPI00320ABC32
MKYLFSILFLLVGYLHTFAQSKAYKGIYIVNKIVDKGEYVDDQKINKKDEINTKKIIYIQNPKKDSINYYEFYDSSISEKVNPYLYTLAKERDFLSLNFKGSDYNSKIKIVFNNQLKTIKIQNKDVFYLTEAYYKYLYKSVYQNQNLPDLVDFLQDFLEDYNFENLKYISSKEKYKHKDFKIIKAYMESYRTQATDYLDKWNIQFLYTNNGTLKYLSKESTEGDQSLEKKLILNKNNTYKYSINRNTESRLITNTQQSFTTDNKYYVDKISSTQVGLGKETNYEIIRTNYKIFLSDQLNLNSKVISEINSSK